LGIPRFSIAARNTSITFSPFWNRYRPHPTRNRLLSSMNPIMYTRYCPFSMNVIISVCQRSFGQARSKLFTRIGLFRRFNFTSCGPTPLRRSRLRTVSRAI
jgi:hypothetical protein